MDRTRQNVYRIKIQIVEGEKALNTDRKTAMVQNGVGFVNKYQNFFTDLHVLRSTESEKLENEFCFAASVSVVGETKDGIKILEIKNMILVEKAQYWCVKLRSETFAQKRLNGR